MSQKRVIYSLAIMGLFTSCGHLKSDERNRNNQNSQEMNQEGYYRTPRPYGGIYFDENKTNNGAGYYQGTPPPNMPQGMSKNRNPNNNLGRGNLSNVSYNVSTVHTFKGQIIRIIRQDSLYGTAQLMQLVIKTGEGQELVIDLGPSSYIDATRINLERGDEIEVIGSEIVTSNNTPMVMAQEVKKDTYSLTLRNKQGQPLWTDEGNKL